MKKISEIGKPKVVSEWDFIFRCVECLVPTRRPICGRCGVETHSAIGRYYWFGKKSKGFFKRLFETEQRYVEYKDRIGFVIEDNRPSLLELRGPG